MHNSTFLYLMKGFLQRLELKTSNTHSMWEIPAAETKQQVQQ